MQTKFVVSFVGFLLIFIAASFCAPTSEGALIQYKVEGVIEGSMIAEVSSGDTWSANFTVDTTTPDSASESPTDGMYYIPLAFDVTVGSVFTRHFDNFRFAISNDYESDDAMGITAPSPSSPEVFDILLIDYDSNAFDSDALPSFINLSDFEYKTMFFAVPAQGYYAQFVGTVTSINVIPEPWLGDINSDDNIDISDVILVLRIALQLDGIKPCSSINGDSAVDISDVILTLRMALGLDDWESCTG